MNKISVVTGTRAEYGLLSNLIRLINQDKNFKLQNAKLVNSIIIN